MSREKTAEISIWCWDLASSKELCGILMTLGHVALEVKGRIYGFYPEEEGCPRGPGRLKPRTRNEVAKDYIDLYSERITKRKTRIEACRAKQRPKERKLPRPSVFIYPLRIPIEAEADLYNTCERFRKERHEYDRTKYNCVHALVDLLKKADISDLQTDPWPHQFRTKQLERKVREQRKKGVIWKKAELREAVHKDCYYDWLAVQKVQETL